MIIPQTGVPNLCIPAAAAAMNQHVAGGGWQPGWRETWKTKTYIRFHLFPLNSRIWGNTRNVQFFCPNPYGQKKLSFWFSRYIYAIYASKMHLTDQKIPESSNPQEPSFAICAMATGLCTFRSGTWKNWIKFVGVFSFIAVWSCMVHFFWVGSISGWWFGTVVIFPYIGNNHPNWLIFFRGVETTNLISFVSCFNLLFSSVFVLGDRFWVKWSRIGCVKKLRTGIQFLLAKSSKSIPVLVVLQSLNNSKDMSFSELL